MIKQDIIESIERRSGLDYSIKEDLKRFISINSTKFDSLESHLTAFLKYGNDLTGFVNGIVSHIEGQVYTVMQAVTFEDAVVKGDVFDLQDTICKEIVGPNQSRIYPKIKGSDMEFVGAVVFLKLNSYIGCPITVENKVYGTLNFSARTEIDDLGKFEQSFIIIEIMAQLVGVLISRYQQLDAIYELNSSLEKSMREMALKNAQLEEFTYIASHDLQEPITTLQTIAKHLEKTNSKEDITTKKSIEYLIQSTDRMSNLVKGLMDHALIGNEKTLETVNVSELIENIKIDFAQQIKENQAAIYYSDLPKIQGYKLDLRLLMQNLISNAIKFRKPAVAPKIDISCEQDDEYFVFSIQDNGIGMKPKQETEVFKLFKRLHGRKEYEGIGIGLSHCKKIIELHQGTIGVESTEGVGSRFYFKIKKI